MTTTVPPAGTQPNAIAFSTIFHENALKAVQRIHTERRLPHVLNDDDGVNSFSWHVSEAVVMSATALEAGINEIAHWLDVHPFDRLAMPDDFDYLKLRMKWSLLPLVARVDPFDRSTSPWQDFNALVDLRNALVHYRLGQSAPSWIRFFDSRHMRLAKPHEWVMSLHSFKVAVWSVNAATEMFAAITQKLGKTTAGDWPWRAFARCDENGNRIPWA